MYRLATIGAPKGLRGQVRLTLHTDNPRLRLAPGTVVTTEPDVGPLTIAELVEGDRAWFARFEGYPDRTAVEALVRTVLWADGVAEEDAWYASDLTGLRAQRPTGEHLGTVVGLEHYPAHDMLVVEEPGGGRSLVPFVEEIVTRIDDGEGIVVIDAPHGLFAADGDVE